MGPVQVELDQDVVAVLEELHRPIKEAARELLVLELYRQCEVSSGKAAELLCMQRGEFDAYCRRVSLDTRQRWASTVTASTAMPSRSIPAPG